MTLEQNLHPGSYEIGLFSKFFMHGRLSGRRSHLYFGPQLRFRVRRLISNEQNEQPYYGFHYWQRNPRILPGEQPLNYCFAWAGSTSIGHAVRWNGPCPSAWKAPTPSSIGSHGSPITTTPKYAHLSTAPGIALGYCLYGQLKG